MIYYQSGLGWAYFAKLFQRQGSVFPRTSLIALPSALIAVLLKFMIGTGFVDAISDWDLTIVNNSGAWSGFSFLVGFLVVFRTSQAYSRFWDGCINTHQMRAEWFDSCSALCSFCVHSKCESAVILGFKDLLIRLFSMMHAAALADIEDCNKEDIDRVKALNLPLIGADSLDTETLKALKRTTCRVELIFVWIQQLVVENISTGVLSIPPPILTRSFQELSNGMVAYNQALKIGNIPFPFPYAQTCDALLVLHWLVCPLVCAQWANHPFWAGVFTFVQVFVLWALNCIAVEIENPFGSDDNDLDYLMMQSELNEQLSMLVSEEAKVRPTVQIRSFKSVQSFQSEGGSSFVGVWATLEDDARPQRSVRLSIRQRGEQLSEVKRSSYRKRSNTLPSQFRSGSLSPRSGEQVRVSLGSASADTVKENLAAGGQSQKKSDDIQSGAQTLIEARGETSRPPSAHSSLSRPQTSQPLEERPSLPHQLHWCSSKSSVESECDNAAKAGSA